MNIVTIFVIIAFVAFLILSAMKFAKYAKMTTHSRFDLYPVPKEGSRSEYGGSYFEEDEWWNNKPRKLDIGRENIGIAKEMFAIKKLWDFQRSQWGPSFVFHWGIYVLLGWSVMLLINVFVGAAWYTILTMLACILGFALATVGTLWLLCRRLFIAELRIYTTPAEYFNLILILAVLVTGILCWTTIPVLDVARLAFGQPTSITTLSPLVVVHFILLGCMMIYIPLSKMGHYAGKFYAFRSVMWDNDPNLAGSKVEENFRASAAAGATTQWAAHMPQPTPETEE